eukprot:TRINITY_DN12187_c0_g1_i1.p1 TRINITY_DN12187_c0_g1~~TRINITY_DN12187_c0_g1_i1.p1  ORF type:complete len:532 (+),score=129.65 TRINITY_DN12187_c0_g1_i1:205-1800(+)
MVIFNIEKKRAITMKAKKDGSFILMRDGYLTANSRTLRYLPNYELNEKQQIIHTMFEGVKMQLNVEFLVVPNKNAIISCGITTSKVNQVYPVSLYFEYREGDKLEKKYEKYHESLYETLKVNTYYNDYVLHKTGISKDGKVFLLIHNDNFLIFSAEDFSLLKNVKLADFDGRFLEDDQVFVGNVDEKYVCFISKRRFIYINYSSSENIVTEPKLQENSQQNYEILQKKFKNYGANINYHCVLADFVLDAENYISCALSPSKKYLAFYMYNVVRLFDLQSIFAHFLKRSQSDNPKHFVEKENPVPHISISVPTITLSRNLIKFSFDERYLFSHSILNSGESFVWRYDMKEKTSSQKTFKEVLNFCITFDKKFILSTNSSILIYSQDSMSLISEITTNCKKNYQIEKLQNNNFFMWAKGCSQIFLCKVTEKHTVEISKTIEHQTEVIGFSLPPSLKQLALENENEKAIPNFLTYTKTGEIMCINSRGLLWSKNTNIENITTLCEDKNKCYLFLYQNKRAEVKVLEINDEKKHC